MIRRPPLNEPVIDPRSQRISRPWAIWFQQWADLSVDLGGEVSGTLPLTSLDAIGQGTLLGRNSLTSGPPEALAVGAGLDLTGTTLSVTAVPSAETGYYEPLTTGDLASPELVYALGDVVSVWVSE